VGRGGLVEVVRQYGPDRAAIIQALRRLLREPKGEVLEIVHLGVSIRGPTDREPRAEPAAG